MKLQFDIADRLRTVEVTRDGHGFRVLVDGVPRLIDVVRVHGNIWSLLVRDHGESTARSVEAVVASQAGVDTVDVHIDGVSIPVLMRNGLGRRSRDSVSAKGTGPQRILAPMPGKVVRILVKPGDQVQTRQGLIVVEAMKMENELRAARDGRVREVFVVEGQSVESGTPLVVVE
ncbi:MAG TPA: biotin/lipoyl-containing protein [Vicinamibacterales bacterium]|nr:biotin/lipoyl-containing protein [Vicinamibacterales bacterium]